MDRDLLWRSGKIVVVAMLAFATALASSRKNAQAVHSAALYQNMPLVSKEGLLRIQSPDPMPPEQRGVLEELLESKIASDMKFVVELYLERDRRMNDKNFEPFIKILETARPSGGIGKAKAR